jgi:hypothetical protein
MLIVDKTGQSYQILDMTDSFTVLLTPGTTANFNDATIRGARPAQNLELESCNFKEVYSVGAHVTDDGKGTTLSWLYSILKFLLLRYRQGLMEARGFERTILSFTPPKLEIEGDQGEQRFLSRYAQITGYARDVWPKRLLPKITSVTTIATLEDSTRVPATIASRSTSIVTDSFGNKIV